ncbi:hypothetical protein FVE85_3338 [Porphyridium purpureum]|uniref:Uncharacterized protein n=1 Tax=Porphyridium purpureum TaxID=35688 RepID=A0A5J4YXA6_PORPP|nr:hypothetical protein FVE85_3338 [Porphyridium purpureum]|eukprot:POR0222..scf227_4
MADSESAAPGAGGSAGAASAASAAVPLVPLVALVALVPLVALVASGRVRVACCEDAAACWEEGELLEMESAELLTNPRRRRVNALFRTNGGDDPHLMRRIQRRQLSHAGASHFSKFAPRDKLRNMQLASELDTFDDECVKPRAPFAQRRSKVVEIVSHGSLMLALTLTGVCAAFDVRSGKRLCFLNVSDTEIIRSLFLNRANQSVVTVSVFQDDNYSSLKCRSTPLEYIRRQRPQDGFELFESEWLKWPGFVEFDDTNGKVLTFSARDRTFKVWDLTNYSLLYEIRDSRIQEIKISLGIMLLVFTRSPGYVPLQIVDIETGEVLKDFHHLLKRSRKIDFMEQFNEKLLVKQENENLQIIDVRTGDIVEVARSKFLTPSAFIFLYQSHMFLTFRNGQVTVWNFKGELVTTFDDHRLWYQDTNTNNIYITGNQELIISYCKQQECSHGSINISSIAKGKCFAKITCSHDDNRHRLALEDVTSLFYNEDRNEIYTGNRNGLVHVWSN